MGGPILTSSSSAVLPVAFDSYGELPESLPTAPVNGSIPKVTLLLLRLFLGGEKATQPFPERHAQAELCEG